MAAGFRLCLFTLLVICKGIHGKPHWGPMFCDLFCEDDDDDNTTPTTSTTFDPDLGDLLFDPCYGCPDTTTTPNPLQPVNFLFPQGPGQNGMNVQMQSQNGTWAFNFLPLTPSLPPALTTVAGQQGPVTSASSTTPTAPTTPTASTAQAPMTAPANTANAASG